ncbi:hypothetical protein NGM99_10075 [Mesorhizobium sp. RP14(2022)]|uniref:Uncharacterized protein n=1 Tax=Mesorhizobium liriopis TaxID=2953882 RepID=A0ABT1C5P2_9HYPH|nr:curli-like amyloid fiber formation chaperone CsgH [Mesorhizobium liriopis]MCO6050139.1 hypothetical protein [Mesorhizobium liriopis]
MPWISNILASAIVLAAQADDASMKEQIIPGESLDSRISACGVQVGRNEIAVLRPFIETSEQLSGHFSLAVKKQSASGTSASAQSGDFNGGKLGGTVAVDRPAKLSVEMTVTATDGKPLCRLAKEIDLGEPEIRT